MGTPTSYSQRQHDSWGRTPRATPSKVVRLGWRHELPDLGAFAESVLPYGQGRSYGDVCLNDGAVLLDTGGLDRLIAFDPNTGLIRCEAGVTLAEILELVVPHGWFLPVTPGTKFVSVGGAVANDVHGKNHHVAGTFGRHITRMELVRSSGERLILEPSGGQADIFAATVGGLGLTGLLTWVEFQLARIQSDQIVGASTKFRSLPEFFEFSAIASARSPFVVSWIDTLRPEGRGILSEGTHAPAGDGATRPDPGAAPASKVGLPIDAPNWVLSPLTVRAFNEAYFRKQRARQVPIRSHYEPFFYPLDSVKDWNRGYGPRGFFQYQFVVPFAEGDAAVLDILTRIAKAGVGSFLAVLKTFGDIPSPGLLSFPRPGVTLALDVPNDGPETVALLRSLDLVVAQAGGRVYPAKDACMTSESFRAFYPNWESFVPFIDPAFSSSFWRRVTE